METIKFYRSFNISEFLICGVYGYKNYDGLLSYLNKLFEISAESICNISYDEYSNNYIKRDYSLFDLKNEYFVNEISILSNFGDKICINDEFRDSDKVFLQSEKPIIEQMSWQGYVIVLEYGLNKDQIVKFICEGHVMVKPSIAWMYFNGEFVKSCQYDIIK